jgi:hypothetical protein
MSAALTPAPDPSHLDLTPDEFERRLAAQGHDADEIHHLWDELTSDRPAPAVDHGLGLGLGPLIAVYLGLLLVVTACSAMLALYWEALGSVGILALCGAYLVLFLGASEVLFRRDLPQPAGVLEAVSLAWVALGTYAALELAGLWPADGSTVHQGVTTIAIVCLVAGAALLAVRPEPLLLVPIAAATALLAVDLAELVFGKTLDLDQELGVPGFLSEREAVAFVLPLGLAWIVAGLWLDATRRRPFATWAHWCGLVLAGMAVMALVPKTVPGFTVVGLLGAAALFCSTLVRHWSFTIVGALGVLIATFASFSELGRAAPIAAAVVGLGLILVGLRWSRWRESIRSATLAHMPAGARRLVQRLAP